jgi:hypothetical protein
MEKFFNTKIVSTKNRTVMTKYMKDEGKTMLRDRVFYNNLKTPSIRNSYSFINYGYGATISRFQLLKLTLKKEFYTRAAKSRENEFTKRKELHMTYIPMTEKEFIQAKERMACLDRLDELNQLELDRFIALLRHKERPLHAKALQAYRDAKFEPKDAIELANHIDAWLEQRKEKRNVLGTTG